MSLPPGRRLLTTRSNLEQESRRCSPSSVGKRNRCVIFPGNVGMTVEALERRKQSWFVRTNVESDLTVQVGENHFHLHKLPMVSRSEYLNRLVFQRRKNGDTYSSLKIQIDNIPGGAQIMELVVKFCYGLVVNLTSTNIVPLYCAAHFLEMSEDLEQGNLISMTEAFLSFVIFSSWKETIQILKSCEAVSSWAEELQVVKRCSESIAWKACTEARAISSGDGHVVEENWWFEDVSFLKMKYFVEVINAIKKKGMKSGLVGACIVYWASRWSSTFKIITHCDHNEVGRVTIESLIRVLPTENCSVSCNFLLHLLKLGLMMKMDQELTIELERRVAMMLESCYAEDLVVKNYGDNDTVYDVSLIIRVVEAYVAYLSGTPMLQGIVSVAKVVDEYLTLVARDKNLSVKSFKLLAEALPEKARYCDDILYRAIDMYLKAHPTLTEEERRSICGTMEYNKLSLEAHNHVMKNDRLPLNVRVRFILMEQINMMHSIVADGSNYRRAKSQEIVRVRRGVGKRCVKPQKELEILKEEVEKMKVKVTDLQVCGSELQRLVKK